MEQDREAALEAMGPVGDWQDRDSLLARIQQALAAKGQAVRESAAKIAEDGCDLGYHGPHCDDDCTAALIRKDPS